MASEPKHREVTWKDLSEEQREILNSVITRVIDAAGCVPSDEGATMVIRLVPNKPGEDDPRILVAIQLTVESAFTKALNQQDPEPRKAKRIIEVELHPAALLPRDGKNDTPLDMTVSLTEGVNPLLDADTKSTEKRRKEGQSRALPPQERVDIRRSLADGAVHFGSFLGSWKAAGQEALERGCDWFDEQAGTFQFGAGLIIAQAASGVEIAVAAVVIMAAQCRRRRR